MARILVYLLNLIFVVFIGWLMSRVLRNLFGSPAGHFGGSKSGEVGGGDGRVAHGTTARDPVCGMFVSTEVSHRLTRGKETLHFCSRECLERYQANVNES